MTGLYIVMCTCMVINCALVQVKSNTEEFCQNEIFRTQCTKNDVILMRNATYGRMNVGRCVTAEEVEAQRARVGDDPSFIGCSVNVLDILDSRCSGKTNCEIPVAEILEKNSRPCFPGLMLYLEASYDCITVVDERRSCLIKASRNPTHIISSSPDQRICGTESQPWIIESSVGQKIKVTLIDFNSRIAGEGDSRLCNNYGTIFDKAGNQNTSICGGRGQRRRKLYTSTGNMFKISFSILQKSSNNGSQFMISIEAIGCSDVIPSEDTWLRRKDDVIVIGCYSTQQTWQLNCNEGKWIGVLGNCSSKLNADHNGNPVEAEMKPVISDQEDVLAIVAISGCTFAVCLIIVCVGIICLRRFYIRYKSQHDYKTLSLCGNPDFNQQLIRGIPSVTAADSLETDDRGFSSKPMPTYSVYVGDNGFKDDRNNENVLINGINQ